jgi:hypothetical protein
MEPIVALPSDRHRYYHDGWMIHDSGRIYRVVVDEEGDLFGYNVDVDNSRRVPLRLEDIHPWYPEGMAINHPEWFAMHIQRRARQCIRRTASVQHYEIVWSYRSLSVDRSIMTCLIRHDMDPQYPSINELDEWENPVAVSPTTIIVPRPEDDPLVVYMGQTVGQLQDGLFVPNDEEGIMAKMIRMENILCI